ncbi:MULTISPECIES: hypothetical protein [Pedobacter]|uniref:hypothetical protein n=1 Tax=Pedobacter TaxID=84567 RepID=UPI000A65C465|nr:MULTISPECIES: hypothetical protein [Pedobacter]
MAWTEQNFPMEMKDLDPRVREKALEIANELKNTREVSELHIVEVAINRAQQWFMNLEG